MLNIREKLFIDNVKSLLLFLKTPFKKLKQDSLYSSHQSIFFNFVSRTEPRELDTASTDTCAVAKIT